MGGVAGRRDWSPPRSPGRIAAAWLQLGPDVGIVFMTVYLYHSEGATIRNRKILQQPLSVVKAYGSPWVIVGDFHMLPDQLCATWGSMIDAVDGYIFASDEPTHCPTRGACRTLDYVICSSTAHDWIDRMTIDIGIPSSHHKALRICFKA